MRNRLMNGGSAYGYHASLALAPEDGTGGGGAGGDAGAAAAASDASALGGDNASPTPSPSAGDGAAASSGAASQAGTSALGGDDPAASAAADGSAEGGKDGAGKEGDGSGKAGDVTETEEEKAARLAKETPEEKEAREKAEAEEAAKHAPASGEYEPLTLPDGYQIADEDMAELTAYGIEKDLPQAEVQRLADMYVKTVEKQNAEWFKTVDNWREAAKNDPEIGGKDRDAKVSIMRQGRDIFGDDPELKQLFQTAGIGDNPALQRFFYRVGKQFGGGGATPRGTPSPEKRTPGQVLYGGQ